MAGLPPKPALPPLPLGWTEHKAPTGHLYYHNKETKESTYKRPIANPGTFQSPSPAPPAPPVAPSPNAAQPTPYNGSFNQPYGANPLQAGSVYNQYNPWSGSTSNHLGFAQQPFSAAAHIPPQQDFHGGAYRSRGGHRGGHNNFSDRRNIPQDKPKHRHDIPGCAPWVLVKTKLGRRFVWNKDTNESFWKFPEDVMKAVVEFDRMEREKKERQKREDDDIMAEIDAEVAAAAEDIRDAEDPAGADAGDGAESSEYEEVEVTDDEEEEEEQPSKRQRTEEPAEDQPVEMGEDDMAWMLAQMEQEQGDDEEVGLPLSDEDRKALFKDLLDDHEINPYHPWDKFLNEGNLYDDERYKALDNMSARKECWQEWSKERIQFLKEERARQEKKDPKIPYVAFLHEKATNKRMLWEEFRRRYKKEPEMKNIRVTDKDREKLYRAHVQRLQKLSQSDMKADLSALLKAQPLSALNRSTTLNTLPSAVLTDVRFISLPARTRDEFVEAYITTLPPAPDGSGPSAEEEAAAARKRADKERRQKALAERERQVEEQKRRQKRDLEYGKARLREEEMEIERAMKVGKEGLMSHFSREE